MTSEFFLNRSMDEIFDTSTHTYCIGVSTTLPEDGVHEPDTNGTGYSRVPLSDLSPAVLGVKYNNLEIVFPQTTSAWGDIVAYAVFDGMNNSSHLLYAKAFDKVWHISSSQMQLVIPVRGLSVALAEKVG